VIPLTCAIPERIRGGYDDALYLLLLLYYVTNERVLCLVSSVLSQEIGRKNGYDVVSSGTYSRQGHNGVNNLPTSCCTTAPRPRVQLVTT